MGILYSRGRQALHTAVEEEQPRDVVPTPASSNRTVAQVLPNSHTDTQNDLDVDAPGNTGHGLDRLSSFQSEDSSGSGAGPRSRDPIPRSLLASRQSTTRPARKHTRKTQRERLIELVQKAHREHRRNTARFKFAIPKATFLRLVQEIHAKMTREDPRYAHILWRASALAALQSGSEEYFQQLLRETSLCATHARRKTIKIEDMRLACQLRRPHVG